MDGSHIGTRTLAGAWANRLFISGGDTILGVFAPMAGERAIVRLHGARSDTVLRYQLQGPPIRLEAEGSPSLTTRPPFKAQTPWTALAEGRIAVWFPDTGMIRVLDAFGALLREIGPITATLPVTDTDREVWCAAAIPQGFLGQRVFEPLRRRARDVIEFPRSLPAVMALEADPTGALWIRKSTAAVGEVWECLGAYGRSRGALRFPPGRRLLHVSPSALVVHAVDENDVEFIEIYERPRWAQ